MSTIPPHPANVVPISSGPPIIRRRPGRPRVVRPQPAHDESEYVAKLCELAHESIENDPLVTAMAETTSPIACLDVIIRSLAEECAGLLYDRERLQAEGRDGVPQLCSRRIDALHKLARLVFERELLKRQAGEMSDETVLQLVGLLTDTAVVVVHEVAPAEMATAFETSLRAQVVGTSWSMPGSG